MIGNKITDKITSVSKKSAQELQNNETEVGVERATPKKRYISPEERQQIKVSTKKGCIFLEAIDELMLTLKKIYISKKKTINYD